MTQTSSICNTSSDSDSPAPARFSLLDDGDRHALTDTLGRTIDHLRLSVTSACNLRCLYCRPGTGASSAAKHLTDDQRLDLIHFFHQSYRLKQLRLTGGEPLLHPSIVQLIASIRSSAPDLTLAMTTNACRLGLLAADLRSAGLDRLNISLDTIDPRTYRELTGGEVGPVLRAIEQAAVVGFPPPKLNAVVLAGVNDGQLLDLAGWAFERNIEIRFLEAMPIGPAAAFNRAHFVGAAEIRRRLSAEFNLIPLARHRGETAKRFAAAGKGLSGTLGIIAPVSEPFCGDCRRMRLTADGRLFPCLLDSRHVGMSACWSGGSFNRDHADELIHQAVAGKRPSGVLQQDAAMIVLGG